MLVLCVPESLAPANRLHNRHKLNKDCRGQSLSKSVCSLTGTKIDEFALWRREKAHAGSTLKDAHLVSQTIVKPETNIRRDRPTMDKGVLTPTRASHDFVREMSHELHTPLNVIIGLCQLLERDRLTTLSAPQRDALERMERNAHALTQTIDHLLACLRSGRFE